MLTPYDFSAIIGLKLGGDRIEVNDSISSVEIRGFWQVRDYNNWHSYVHVSLHWNSLMSGLGEHYEFTLLVEFEGY